MDLNPLLPWAPRLLAGLQVGSCVPWALLSLTLSCTSMSLWPCLWPPFAWGLSFYCGGKGTPGKVTEAQGIVGPSSLVPSWRRLPCTALVPPAIQCAPATPRLAMEGASGHLRPSGGWALAEGGTPVGWSQAGMCWVEHRGKQQAVEEMQLKSQVSRLQAGLGSRAFTPLCPSRLHAL